MNITLNDTEIRQALCEYVGKRGFTISGSDIKLIAGRGDNGNRAEIDIDLLGASAMSSNALTRTTEQVAADPVKTTKAATESPFATGTADDSPQVEATEETKSTVTDTLKDKGADVTKKPSKKKRAKKDLFSDAAPKAEVEMSEVAEETKPVATPADTTPKISETEDETLNRMRAETLAEQNALDAEDAALDAQTDDPKDVPLGTDTPTETKSLFA